MKRKTKLIAVIIIFIVLMCLEIFGLQNIKQIKILFCNSNQSIDIKEELSRITGALPSTGTYSVKAVTREDERINIYYMYDGKISGYETTSYNVGITISQNISDNAIEGEMIYWGIIISTVILFAILTTYLFVSKNPINGFIKIGYFILSIGVLTFLLCIVPMLSKNHGGNIYYYTIIIGTYLIGAIYGLNNKAFFIPTVFIIPILFIARWLNYRHGLLWLDDICAYIFLNFMGSLTGRILNKNKGMKRKHFTFYAVISLLLVIGSYAEKIKSRTATSMISDCCKIGLLGILFSVIFYFAYIIIKKIKEVRSKSEKEVANEQPENKARDRARNNKSILYIVLIVVLIIVILTINYFILKPNNYVETNLQTYSEKLDEQFGYRLVEQKVYITCDYGANWLEVPYDFVNIYKSDNEFPSNSYYMDKNKMIFENISTDDIIGVVYSDDNGETWQIGQIKDTGGYIIYLKFFDKENGIAMICTGTELGQREHIRASKTTDGGKTWTTQKEEKSSIRINRGAEIEFTSMDEGTIENISYDGSKTIYETTDGGVTWTVND